MKSRIETIPELSGNVVVYRSKDVESELKKRMAKTKGKCVIIRLITAKNESKTDKSAFIGNYTVTLFTVPLLTAGDAKDADDLLAEIEDKLNNWWPENLKSNTRMSLKTGDIAFREEGDYDIAQIMIKSPLTPLKPVTGDT